MSNLPRWQLDNFYHKTKDLRQQRCYSTDEYEEYHEQIRRIELANNKEETAENFGTEERRYAEFKTHRVHRMKLKLLTMGNLHNK